MTAENNDKTTEPPCKKARPSLTEAHPHHAGGAEALRLAAGDHEKKYDGDIVRKRTEVEEIVIAKEQQAEEIVEALPKDSTSVPSVELFLPEILKDATFVGHLVTDLDSVAGAIGAAELYGGTPALASEINSETAFALERFNVEKPRPIEDILKENPKTDICLVDHQQTSQMNPSIDCDQVVGVIDHHALQSKTLVTDKPIYIDIRPWGSMSTIIAHTFLTHKRRPPTAVAGMLLCAILSDTLNLLGPTTTDWDRLMVAVLADIAGVDDIQLLASQQFKAKSKELANLSAVGLVNGDQKSFSYATSGFTGDIGFAVVETTDDDIIMDRIEEMLPEMVACKKEKKLQCIFLAIVNIVKLKSCLLLCGPTETSLAQDAFGGEILRNGTVMDLGKRVSRKKDYIPVLTKTIKEGWSKPKNLPRGPSNNDIMSHLEIDPQDPYGNVKRINDTPNENKDGVMEKIEAEEKKDDGEYNIVIA
mmetsp:Transcript_1530/g.2431  ORF Transcript_1530/g.2431 Transcript_1530/m.2431 type:complete len:476 (-) Transcript_1530:238-1665(-)|eukprot:CAMPEP_0195294780 /NCGR_PEP_ID=MMETSP0707-20130614/15862_1 /TAXON_ID=33640 /ORGANISM="Asterionellopsis glacialis, Strain CCMP134" /LENGTH=475 /DNA_ID=CAMNT_0040355837 /DNA_START=79 /DNA_END=1506 /DNA_ORIENTATION=+